jgi:hypothetical protein
MEACKGVFFLLGRAASDPKRVVRVTRDTQSMLRRYDTLSHARSITYTWLALPLFRCPFCPAPGAYCRPCSDPRRGKM